MISSASNRVEALGPMPRSTDPETGPALYENIGDGVSRPHCFRMRGWCNIFETRCGSVWFVVPPRRLPQQGLQRAGEDPANAGSHDVGTEFRLV
jgi:hypothetical protein